MRTSAFATIAASHSTSNSHGRGRGGGSVSCWDKQKTVRLNMGGDAADLIMNDFAK